MNRFFRMFSMDQGEPVTLDHVPLHEAPNHRHQEKLAEAARRHGKPFKCASDGLPRELLKDGRDLVTIGTNVHRLQSRKA